MKVLKSLFLLLAAIMIAGCANNQEIKQPADKLFKSEAYGFSFEYPSNWIENKEGLPGRWAIVDEKKNTILFIVAPAKSDDLLVLGRSMALKDVYGENIDASTIKKEDLIDIIQIVKLDSANNMTWYNYGMKFKDKNIDSFISGTICDKNEVTLVLVSGSAYNIQNQETYKKLLNTFKC